jgi:hypothetical protein
MSPSEIFFLILFWIVCAVFNFFYVFRSGIVIWYGHKLATPKHFFGFFGVVLLSGPIGSLVAIADWLSTFYYAAKTAKAMQELRARDDVTVD